MSSVRKISPYSTNQGNEGTCWAHSTARLISRLIKTHVVGVHDEVTDEFYDSIMFEEGELLDEYYNTINCSTENTIFHCIIHAQAWHERKGKPFSMHKSLNKVINWESENLSAMLFHFIFNSIKNKYCHLEYLPVRGASAPIFYFLKLLRKGITEDKIKDILKYNDYQIIQVKADMAMDAATIDLPHGWQARMSRTKNRPYWLNTLTGKETWKDPRGITPPPSPASPISPSLVDEDNSKKKRGTYGYILFYNVHMDDVKAQLTVGDKKSNITEIFKRLATMWTELDSQEKALWNARAKETKGLIGGGLIFPTIQQVQENKIMFSRLITKLASVFELIRISFKKKTLKIILARSIGLGDFITINDKYGYRDMTNPSLKCGEMYKGIGTHIYTSLSSTSKHTDWFEKITRVLEYGLYVLLTIYEHAILITAIEGDFFIVKNSWGVSKNWTLPNDEQFIVDNKLSISTLVDHATRDERPRDVELLFIELGGRDNYEIFTKKKLPKKSIIHTLKKTAKRLSACFGMGKKNKTQNKFKKYHKKLSKNDKTIKKCSKK
jgi:hypothetical protein